MSCRVCQIGFVLGSLVVAHIIASYICLYFQLERLEDRRLFGAENVENPRIVYVPASYKKWAPLHVVDGLINWTKVTGDDAQSAAILWCSYLAPLLLFAVAPLLIKRFLSYDADDE